MLGLGILVLMLMQMVMGYLRAALLISLQGRIDAQMMLGFVEHLLALPYGFFRQRSSGDLLMRLSSNSTIRDLLTSQTVSILLDGAFVLGYLAIILARDPLFGCLVLAFGVLEALILFGTRRRMQDLMQRKLAAQSTSQSYLAEALAGMATLKAAGSEERAFDHWSDLFYAELNASLQQSHLSALISTATNALRAFAPLALLWVGAVRVLDGTMSLGTMLALNALAIAFLTPLASLAENAQRLQTVGAYLERIADVVQTEPEQDPMTVTSAPTLSGRIELRDVTFSYGPQTPPVLRNISLTVEPGQKVALVGRTGSGKSTLAQLLLGLYTPASGEILYDGQPLQSLNYRTLRGQFGVVLQEARLFSGSIRQNIAVDNPAASLDRVEEAACLAAIHEDIEAMPMGYETLVAEGGTALSGGQRQRVALARALIRKPAVLLLDEATSHLDTVTEQRVDQNLSALSCTRIVIAHRLSTIRNADFIVVLNQGSIVEHGTHQELLDKGGHYAALVGSRSGQRESSEGPSLLAAS
jgi:ABC-type bacteriocin/lantibiotic exporter with double-glycine peptidase domain